MNNSALHQFKSFLEQELMFLDLHGDTTIYMKGKTWAIIYANLAKLFAETIDLGKGKYEDSQRFWALERRLDLLEKKMKAPQPRRKSRKKK